MKKEEHQSSRYDFKWVGGQFNTYFFDTTHQVRYEVVFKPTPYLFGEDSIFSFYTFEFSILVAQNPTNKLLFDSLIAPTIAAIFADFYHNSPETIAIYICDSSDNRHLTRMKKFNRWFEYYKGDSFVKIDSGFKESDGTLYPVSLIIKEKNPFRVQIFEAFLNVIDGYNSDK